MPNTDDLPQLREVLDALAIEHPDVLAWLAEARRLFAEVEERFAAGRILPALSSLAAVPPLHHLLTERFFDLLLTAEAPDPEHSDLVTGMYL